MTVLIRVVLGFLLMLCGLAFLGQTGYQSNPADKVFLGLLFAIIGIAYTYSMLKMKE